jgi:hypothetical protein
MLTGIDHVLVACAEPDAAALALESQLGLRASAGGRHEAHGTFNRIVWLGDSYVELLGVSDATLAARSWWGRHALAVLAAGHAAGYMGVVLASDQLEADTQALRAHGSLLGEPEAGSRLRPDGRLVRWRLAHEPTPDPDLGLLFLIEHDRNAAEWTPAEVAQRRAGIHPLGGPARLERLELPVAAMKQATMRVHRDIGVAFRPSLAGEGARDGAIGRQTLRLYPSFAGRRPTIVIRGGSEPVEVELLGCRWRREAAAP